MPGFTDMLTDYAKELDSMSLSAAEHDALKWMKEHSVTATWIGPPGRCHLRITWTLPTGTIHSVTGDDLIETVREATILHQRHARHPVDNF